MAENLGFKGVVIGVELPRQEFRGDERRFRVLLPWASNCCRGRQTCSHTSVEE